MMIASLVSVGPNKVSEVIHVQDMSELGKRLLNYVSSDVFNLKWVGGGGYRIIVDGSPEGLLVINEEGSDAENYCREGESPPIY